MEFIFIVQSHFFQLHLCCSPAVAAMGWKQLGEKKHHALQYPLISDGLSSRNFMKCSKTKQNETSLCVLKRVHLESRNT